jgi:hypothetical protein
VRTRGFEPPRACAHSDLNAARIPDSATSAYAPELSPIPSYIQEIFTTPQLRPNPQCGRVPEELTYPINPTIMTSFNGKYPSQNPYAILITAIIGTLYNIEDINNPVEPHDNPQPNNFGIGSERNYPKVKDLLAL